MNIEYYLVALTAVFVLGIGAQWLAWRLRLPAILLMLLAGFLAGPVARQFGPSYGYIDPERLFGDLLFPVVSLSVAIILFEGSLGLRFSQVREVGWALGSLLTIGALVTWVLATTAAMLLLGMSFPIALLLGGILVVTGPTVIGPLLRDIRPIGRVGPVARWEGIVVDPIGAVLAVLVFETLTSIEGEAFGIAASHAGLGLLETVAVGGIIGSAAAWLLILALRRQWIPDFLQSPVVLMIVLAAFTASNLLQHESGLLTVTLMGIWVANQRTVPVRHITEFKENLRQLILAYLFVLLAARLRLEDIAALGPGGLAFVAALILVVRPASVFISTLRSRLDWRERVLLAWLAPRGIVAAAVSSLFAIRLSESEILAEAGQALQSAVFLVIVGTVTVYGLTAPILARRLGLSIANPQGVLIAGAHAGVRAIAKVLSAERVPVLLVDTNRGNVQTARLEGIDAYYASILSERTPEELDLGGIGHFLAMTRNAEVNSLASMHFIELFGRAEVYQLVPQGRGDPRKDTSTDLMPGRFLFRLDVTYETLDAWFAAGATMKRTRLTEKFSYDDYRKIYGENALPMFTIDELGRLQVFTVNDPPRPRAGHTLISLVRPGEYVETPAESTDAKEVAS